MIYVFSISWVANFVLLLTFNFYNTGVYVLGWGQKPLEQAFDALPLNK